MKESETNDPIEEKVERMEESSPSYDHKEENISGVLDVENRARGNLNAVFENPLAGIPRDQLFKDVVEFCQKYDLMDHVETFKKGALISQDPSSATSLPELSDHEREALEREHTHKWSQPWQLYFLACMWEDLAVSLTYANLLSLQQCAHSLPLYKVWMRQSITVLRLSTLPKMYVHYLSGASLY